MTVCLPASSVSHGLHITNSLSATKSLIKEAVGLPSTLLVAQWLKRL